ncbi:LacI family DNA-binding transcriptional regulator [soil metagenome]
MRDVAALAGVSLKTVSRVVNREAGVTDELVARVTAAAERLDYRPNLTASSLRRGDGRTRTIGLLLDNIANPFSASLYGAIEEVARPLGVVVLAGSLDEDGDRERGLAESFIARRVDGLIIAPTRADQSYLQNDQLAGTALVFVDRAPTLLAADSVTSTNADGARVATQHLLDHGHRRIAFLGVQTKISTGAQRHAGYCDALDRAGLTAEPALVRQGLRSSEEARGALLEMLDLPEPPTAVFASQVLLNIGAIQALRDRGLQHRVALVGFDDVSLADLIDPPVTLVAQDVPEMGRIAATRLFARLDGDESPPQQLLVPTTLVVRGSGEIRPT